MYADEDASVLWKVCSEGRIKGFDLKSLQEKVALVPPQSLDTKLASVCCHAYRKANGKSFMAFGLSDNTVAVWDLDRGVIFQTLKMTSTPVCCCFSNDMKSVFLVVQSNATCILQLDLKSGKEVLSIDSGKKRIVSVQVNPKADDVLTVITSNGVKLVDAGSGRKKRLDVSCPNGVFIHEHSSCGKYLIIAGAQENELLVFNIASETCTTPIAVLPVANSISNVIIRSKGKKTLEILVTFTEGGGVMLLFDERKSLMSRDIDASIHIGCAYFSGSVDSSMVLVEIHGHKYKMQRMFIRDAQGDFITDAFHSDITLDETHDKTGGVSNQIGMVNKTDVFVVGPFETNGKKRPLVSDEIVGEKRVKEEALSMESASLTLEERLEYLSKSMETLEGRSDVGGETPTSDSLVVLVDQALQAGDDLLLEQCLACANTHVIEATAEALPVGRVLLLMKRLVAKFEKRPSRGILLTRWLSAILRHHLAFLVSLPDLANQLGGLSHMLEQRLMSYSRLSGLGGRLDMLLSQLNKREKEGMRGETSQFSSSRTLYIEE